VLNTLYVSLEYDKIARCWHVFGKINDSYTNEMKNILIYVLTSFILCSFTSLSVDDVVTAMKNGNASQISRFFDNTVEITFPDKSNSYSKSQAELVLKDFFNTNGVKTFMVVHRGDNENENSQYCVGILQTKNGEFRTTFYLKQKGERQLLQELRFEK
jgi:hypothetical protein